MPAVAELILEPPAQKIVIDLLTAELAGRGDPAKVSARISEGRCVRVTLTGGDEVIARVLCHPWLTLEAFDATITAAERLMQLCVGLLRQAENTVRPDGSQIYGVTALGAGSEQVDPDTERPKFTRTLAVGMRAVAV